jgi:ABC-2 type transport system ATP-binding protein
MPAIEVAGLTIRYGDVLAVDDLSFDAEAGQVTCVLGRNGAGKTSTIEALEGLRRPHAGRLSVIGLDPRRDHKVLVTRIGVMLQDGGIHPAARVGELARHAAALYPQPVDTPALLERLSLTDLSRRTFRQLSGGEQRRLAMALALIGRPQVVFLDEPTAGVDPAGRQQIRAMVGELRADGVTVLLSTHDLDEAERVADRVVIIDSGRLVASGTIDELQALQGSVDEVRFHAPTGLDTVGLSERLDGAPVTEARAGEYVVAAAATPALVATLTAWLAEHDVSLTGLQTGRRSLEDIFVRLTGPATPATDGTVEEPAPEEPEPEPESEAAAQPAEEPAPAETEAEQEAEA